MSIRTWAGTLVLAAAAAPAAPGQVSRATAHPSPDGTELLAEGPLAVTVRRYDAATTRDYDDKGTLLFVTRANLYYRPANRDAAEVHPAADGTAPHLHGEAPADGRTRKLLWRVDPKTKQYDGPALTAKVVDAAPLPRADPKDVNYFLYHALDRLQARADDALAAGDKKLLDVYAARADRAARYIAAEKLDPKIGEAYAGLPAFLAGLQRAAAEIDETIADAARKDREAVARAREAAARHQAQATLGLFQGVMGAIPDVTYSRDSDGWVRRHEQYDMGGVMSGLATMAQAQANLQAERQRLLVARQVLGLKAKERVEELQAGAEAAKRDRKALVRKVGVDRLGLPADSPLDGVAAAREAAGRTGDPDPVLDLLRKRVGRDKGESARDNPFALADLYLTTAEALGRPKAGTPADVFGLAEKAVAAARLVPPGAAFDFEWADLLASAAALACQAAAAETHNGSWARAYSPWAAYAVRVLDQAGASDEADVTGEARERRAVALMLAGRTAESLKQAEAVYELRKDSRSYQFTLARLYCTKPDRTRADITKALDALDEAIKRGFCDIPRLKTGADFANLRADKTRFDTLTKLDAGQSMTWDAAGGTFAVTNRSKYAITNVVLRVEVLAVQNGRQQKTAVVRKEPFPQVRPGETVRWEGAIAAPREQVVTGVLRLTCDQGKLGDVPSLDPPPRRRPGLLR